MAPYMNVSAPALDLLCSKDGTFDGDPISQVLPK